MTNYTARITFGSDATILSTSEAVELKKSIGAKLAQKGIYYMPTGELAMSSTDAHDVLQALKKKYWTHSSRPAQAKSGQVFYIITNKTATAEYGTPVVVKTTVGEVTKVTPETDWASATGTV